MKKLLLSLILVFSVVTIMAQIPRKMVVLEIGTGTWCTYCPGAAMGADDLLEAGCFVAVIENHNGDAFANNYSNARNTYYQITGYPTAVFDGVMKYVGGDHNNSLYNVYRPRYNTRIGIPSNFDMSMEVSTTDSINYTVDVTVTKVAPSTATNLVLHFAVTQSNIQFNWQGQTHLEHVNRLMVPDQNGTPLDFSSGDVQTVSLNFVVSNQYPLEDIEFIAFVQTNTNKEIQQGIKRAVIDLTPGFVADNTQVPHGGVVNFTNTTFGGYIGTPERYEWFFEGGTPATDTIENPVITYDNCGPHDVTLIVNRGGQIDTLVKEMYINVGPVVNISAAPGDTVCSDQSITLDGTTQGATSYAWLPGGQTTPAITVDTNGTGAGLQTYTLIVTTTPDCSVTKTIDVFFDNCTGTGSEKTQSLGIYPNPNNGTFSIEINAEKAMTADLKIINTVGATIYSENGINITKNFRKNVSLNNVPSGIYFLTISSGEERIIKKMVIK